MMSIDFKREEIQGFRIISRDSRFVIQGKIPKYNYFKKIFTAWYYLSKRGSMSTDISTSYHYDTIEEAQEEAEKYRKSVSIYIESFKKQLPEGTVVEEFDIKDSKTSPEYFI